MRLDASCRAVRRFGVNRHWSRLKGAAILVSFACTGIIGEWRILTWLLLVDQFSGIGAFQYTQSRDRGELSKLERQQRQESLPEVRCEIAQPALRVVCVFARHSSQHDTGMFASEIVRGLTQIHGNVACSLPEFEKLRRQAVGDAEPVELLRLEFWKTLEERWHSRRVADCHGSVCC